MSIQSKISKSQSTLKRRLRDYSVFVSGTEIETIHLTYTETKYGDKEYEVIDHGKVVIALDISDEIPLDRVRTDVTKPAVTSQSTFFYDILPIIGMARFEDNVERGDLLIYRFYDEHEGKITNEPLILVLQVSEILGSIAHERLTGRTFYCSPHNIALPQEVQNIIVSYNEE